MNSTVSAEVAAFIEEQAAFAVDDHCSTAIAIVMMWHYLLTLDKEVAYFWKRKPTGACALFFANRYLTLIVVIYNTPWWDLSNTYIPLVSIALEMGSMLIDVLLVDIISRVPLMIADSIVIVVTRFVTRFHRRKTPPRVFGTRRTITSVLYKYGGIHFLLITIYNALRLLESLLLLTLDNTATDRAHKITGFVGPPLAGILMSYFLIALQEALPGEPAEGYDSGSASSVGTLCFVRADVDSWAAPEPTRTSTSSFTPRLPAQLLGP
ncbi:hypothetical protein VTO73DRAFT_13874 [Trametes versicolor]